MRDGRAAMDLVAERIPATLALTIPALIIKLGIGIPAGIIAALNRGSLTDRLVMLLSVAGFTVPSFVLGLVAGADLRGATGLAALRRQDSWRHAILPIATLGIGGAAVLARFTLSAMLEVLGQPYVRTASAKGVPWRQSSSAMPCPTPRFRPSPSSASWSARSLPRAVAVESVFSWPGVGRLLVVAVSNRDLAVVQCILLLVAATMVVSNLIVDFLYVFLDPRLRHAGGRSGS